MEKPSLPYVLIKDETWQEITAEVQYWADKGRAEGNGPIEAVFYPLAALMLRKKSQCTPFAPIELKDIEYFAVAKTFIPPREFANYSSFSAQFRDPDGNNKRMETLFTKSINKIHHQSPQLLFLGPGHSHPFAIETTMPSACDIDHHIRPYRRKNEELLGLSFSLALIVVQTKNSDGWQACAYAMDEKGSLHQLGIARVVKKDNYQLKQALARPFFRTRRGRVWERFQQARLGNKLLQHEHWLGGWSTFLYRCDDDTAKLVILPPRFPTQPALEQTINLTDRSTSELKCWNYGNAYRNYQLGENGYDYLVREA